MDKSFLIALLKLSKNKHWFSSGASAEIQNSAALPIVQSLCYSAARLKHRCLMSETCGAWNRADPVFDAWYWSIRVRSGAGGLPWAQIETSKMVDLTEDNILKLIQCQTVFLLLWAFSSFSNIATSTPAVKHHQIIMLIGKLTGWSHFDDLPLSLENTETLPYMEQCTLNCCVCVASVGLQTLVACICLSTYANAWRWLLPPYFELSAVCNGPKEEQSFFFLAPTNKHVQ